MSVVHYTFNNTNVKEINFLINLHRNLYDAGCSADYPPISKGIMLQFKNQILHWDKVEFLTELFSLNFHSDYTLKLLLAFPELWTDFKLEDWISIITNTKRIIPKPLGAYEGCFSDIQFVCRYLNLDGFQMLLLSGIDVAAKKNIVNYFRMHPFILDPSIEEHTGIFNNVEENIFNLLKDYNELFFKSNTTINSFETKDLEEMKIRIKKAWKILDM